MKFGWGPMLSKAALEALETRNGHDYETLQNWSSLIGITTAIIGNVLIALALNVQRYAHTRLHRERTRNRQRSGIATKRAVRNGNQSASSYGAITDNADGTGGNEHIGGGANDHIGVNEVVNANGGSDHESDPLVASHQFSGSEDSSNPDDQDETTSTYLKSPYWWLGQVLITLGEMGNFLAYGFAPASIVSPLGVVALISNCIIAPAMFHERFRHRDFWGVVIAVGGVITVVLSANQEETKLNPHDVLDAITTLQFKIYVSVTVILIAILMWASGQYGRGTILIDLGLVGLFGGYTALATKGVSSMLSSMLWRAFTTPITYVLILILLVTAVMQIRYVNKALQRFDSTQVIPIQFVLFTLCVILGSAILYGDFEKTNTEQAGKFIGGCLLTFFGVFLITSGRHNKDDEDILSDTDGVEETIGLINHDGNPCNSPLQSQSPKTQSRRSSRLSKESFAETMRPTTPPGNATFLETRHFGSTESPGSVEAGATGPIPSSPWEGALNPSTSSPTPARKLSAPPNLATPVRELLMAPACPSERPVTPRLASGLSKTASGGYNRSRTFISPSPLSSTVTTVVKDGFLRDNDDVLSHGSSMRRLRSSIRASLFFGDEDDGSAVETVLPVSEENLPRGFVGQDTEPDRDTTRRRSRSVSDTLGDLFRANKKNESTSVGNGASNAA